MAWISGKIDRRRWLGSALAAGLGLAAPRARAVELPGTPSQTRGPFYPHEPPLDADADLVRVGGRDTLARGVITHLGGVVRDSRGRPARRAWSLYMRALRATRRPGTWARS